MNCYKGFVNKECAYYPCHALTTFKHQNEFNCLFCYCPFYWLECPGRYLIIIDVNGIIRKDCSNCKLPHDGYEQSWSIMNKSKYAEIPKYWNGNTSMKT